MTNGLIQLPTGELHALASQHGIQRDQLDGALSLRSADITAVNTAARTATIRLGGDTTDIPDIAYINSYLPSTSDTGVLVLVSGTQMWLIGALSAGGASDARHGCQVYKDVSALDSGAVTEITWATEMDDTDGFISVSSPTITVPTGFNGVYTVTFRVVSTSGLTGRAFVEIAPSTSISNTPPEFRNFMDTANEDRATVVATFYMAVADSFVCRVFHASGGPKSFESWASCYRVGS